MNFKNNKGYVVVDATIAVIILMILIPVLMGMVYRVNLTNHETKIKAEVINILVNTIETAKGIELENLTEEKVINKLQDTYTISDIIVIPFLDFIFPPIILLQYLDQLIFLLL